MSSGCAYVQGYRTERLSTSYKDIDKPRTFATEMNKTLTSDFGNYVFMTNLFEAPRLYETIEFYDEATVTPGTAAGQPIGKARVTNFAYESGASNPTDANTLYRANLIDTGFYTKITTSGGTTWTAGNYVVGSNSGATGYIVAVAGSATAGSQNFFYLYNITEYLLQEKY